MLRTGCWFILGLNPGLLFGMIRTCRDKQQRSQFHASLQCLVRHALYDEDPKNCLITYTLILLEAGEVERRGGQRCWMYLVFVGVLVCVTSIEAGS
jgi:hypothetical protein